ncbi:MAG: GNAT family N-acetyltransferase [Oscillospiraceae bacterium]|nr:GNAT family N-acetyltransferase [Oscillospiraceae bacterium]
MITRKTTPAEEPRAAELFAIAFEQPLDRNEAPDPNFLCTHQRWASFDEHGSMMSTLSALALSMRFDGNICSCAGIGGVATLPQYRRSGGIRECFRTMLPQLYEQGCELSYLYPFSTAYYRRFGYENCVQRLNVSVDLSQLQPEPFSGSCRLSEASAPLKDEIRSIDACLESHYNMAVQHTDADYAWVLEQDPAARQEFCYVCYRKNGAPCSYTVFRKQDQADGRNLVCSRFCFLDREGFDGLMHLFKSLASDHRYVKFTLPNTPAMRYLLPEWSLGAVIWATEAAGMVRAVNVRRLLEKAAYLGSGCIRLKICDEQIPQNNGCFRVEFCSGRAISVQPCSDEPDLSLGVAAFSALICGVSDFSSAAQWMPGIQVHDPQAPCSSLFYPKPMMIADYF